MYHHHSVVHDTILSVYVRAIFDPTPKLVLQNGIREGLVQERDTFNDELELFTRTEFTTIVKPAVGKVHNGNRFA